MPTAFDAVSSVINQTGTPISFTHTPVGTPTGVVVKVLWRKTAGGDTVNSVTYGGTAMTFHGRKEDPGVPQRAALEYWKLGNPASGARTVEVTFSAAPVNAGVSAITYTGTTTVTADLLGTFASADGEATNPSITVTSAADDLVDGALMIAGQRVITEGAGQTMRAEDETAGGGDDASWQNDTEPGAASVTVSWTFVINASWVAGGTSVMAAAVAEEMTIHQAIYRGRNRP